MKRRLILGMLLLLTTSVTVRTQMLTQLSPANTIAGATDMTLTVYGSGFLAGATVNWNGAPQATAFVASNELQATINSALLASQGAAQVTVTQSGVTTAWLVFQVLTPVTTVTSYTPTVFTSGFGVIITVNGQGFEQAATVFFDWFPLATTWISSGQLSAVLPGGQISGSGPHHVFVYNAPVPTGMPSLAVPQYVFTFGSVIISTPTASSFTITNVSQSNVTLGSPYYVISGLNAGDFTNPGGAGSCTNSQVLAPAASCTIYVTFTPSTTGNEIAVLTLSSSGVGSPQHVTLSGTGAPIAAPAENFSFTVLAFGNVQTGTTSQPIITTLTNSGTSDLVVSALSVTGVNAADFALAGTCTNSTTLTPGTSCTLSVTFTPSTTSTESANISITDNTVGSISTIGLTGTGTTTSAHSVVVGWIASTSASITGYNVYRGTTTGGPYSLLTPTPVAIDVDFISWTASVTSGVTGYNVYRAPCLGTITATVCSSEGVFVKINSSLVTVTNYTDSAMTTGQGWVYYATSVCPTCVPTESVASGHYAVAVPGYTDTSVTHSTQYFYVVTSVGANPPYSPTESLNSTEVSTTP